MKTIVFSALLVLSTQAFAERGPYFENAQKAPVTHGKLVFNSPELSSLENGLYIGDVIIEKKAGGFEVGPMIYKCIFNEDDGAYGSLGCKYLRYDQKRSTSYSECQIYDSEYYSCY